MTIGASQYWPNMAAGLAYPRVGMMRYPQLWKGIEVAWYPFACNQDQRMIDWSGTGRHCTSWTNYGTGIAWTQGTSSLLFTAASSGRAEVTLRKNMSQFANMSLMWWYRRGSSQPSAYSQAVTVHGYFGANEAASMPGLIKTTGGTYTIAGSLTTDQELHCQIVTWSSALNRGWLYQDGRYIGTVATTGAMYNTLNKLIIGCAFAYGNYWNGNLYEVRLYDNLLTSDDAELLSLYPGISYEMDFSAGKSAASPPAATSRNLTLLGVG